MPAWQRAAVNGADATPSLQQAVKAADSTPSSARPVRVAGAVLILGFALFALFEGASRLVRRRPERESVGVLPTSSRLGSPWRKISQGKW